MAKTSRMKDFVVEWQIDIVAATPEAAARKAWAAMRRRGSIANSFDVIDQDGEVHKIDLMEIGQERATRRLKAAPPA